MDSTNYYDKKSKFFYLKTVHIDLQEHYKKFLSHLPKQGRILDAGCGVGRDSKFFLGRGYDTVPFDGSLEMVKMAANHLGKNVLHMFLQNVNFSGEFDAIWAHASLLHTPYENLREIIRRFHKSLLPSGIFYASFRYGISMRKWEDLTFFDMNETNMGPYLEGLFQPLEIWKSRGTRNKMTPSSDGNWFSFIARRIETTDP